MCGWRIYLILMKKRNSSIVTISREFGSGGRELGKRLADALGYAYYDNELLAQIVERSKLDADYVAKVSERGLGNFTLHRGNTFAMNKTAIAVLVTQQKIIKELAEKGNCVFVGRGAEIILRNYQPFKLFISADTAYKIKRCRTSDAANHNLSDKELLKKFKQIDRNRRKLHDLLSNTAWGDCRTYTLCVNTTDVEIAEIVPALAAYIKAWQEQTK